MYRSLFVPLLLAAASQVAAQTHVHQVLVLNEGRYNFVTSTQEVPVTLGSYDPGNGVYQVIDTLHGPRFGSEVIVADGLILVAADDRLRVYDADSHQLLNEATVAGIRQLAVWNGQVLITRGELGGLDHYFESRDLATLGLLYAITPADGLQHSTEDVKVVGDKAYLAVNNAFDWGNFVGRIGIVDLPTGTYEQEIDLGPDGLNPEHIMIHGQDILVFNNKQFDGSSISRVDPLNAQLVATQNVAVQSGCAASALVVDQVYYLEYALGQVARFDAVAQAVLDTLPAPIVPYGMVHDPINGVIYATTTDFVASGALHVLDADMNELSSVPVSVAPGKLALDVRAGVGMGTRPASTRLHVFPVPATDQVLVELDIRQGNPTWQLVDAAGRVALAGRFMTGGIHRVAVDGLTPGAYVLHAEGLGQARVWVR